MFELFGLVRQSGPMKIKHGKDDAPNGNCITYEHNEYFYRIHIGYDLSHEWMGETKIKTRRNHN